METACIRIQEPRFTARISPKGSCGLFCVHTHPSTTRREDRSLHETNPTPTKKMTKRVAVIAIWIENREVVAEVNRLLSDFQELMRGRMGVPFRDFGANLISLILEGNTDQLGALAGKLGMLPGVTAKTTYLTK